MNRKAVIIIITIVLVAGLGAGVWFFVVKKKTDAATLPTSVPGQPSGGAQGFPAAATQYQVNVEKSQSATAAPWWSVHEGRGVRNLSDGKIYLIQNGKRLLLSSSAAYNRMGWPGRYEDAVAQGFIKQLLTAEINQIPPGPTLSFAS